MSQTIHRAIRLALASLLAVALISQLLVGMSRSDLSVVNFFSYFTVLSNTAAIVMLVLLAARPGRDDSVAFAVFRGAVTVYMTVTGIIYAFVLAPHLADVAVPEPWIDWSIHVVGPVAVVLDWLFWRPTVRIPLRALLIWLVFAAAYLAYTVIRGAMAGWYPYPFLDPAESGGNWAVVLWSLVVLAVILGVSFLALWWVNRSHPDDVDSS
ncbi:MAG: Pr6Pr family membrane protein [Acidimicrobiia bacterium]